MHTPPHPYYHPHPQLPYPAYHYPTRDQLVSQPLRDAPSPSVAPPYADAYDARRPVHAATSSLVYALNERGFPDVRFTEYRAPGFPDNEVVPYALSPSSTYTSASPPEHRQFDNDGESHSETYSTHTSGMHGDVVSDDEGLAAYAYEEPPAASPYESVTDYASPSNIEHETDTEVGYFNGQMVTLGLVVDEHLSDEYLMARLVSPTDNYAALGPHQAPPFDTPPEHPSFLSSRSYTLAEAITPLEERHPRLHRSHNKSPDASSLLTSSVGSGASISPHMGLPDPSCQDIHPDYTRGSSASAASSPPASPPAGSPQPTFSSQAQQHESTRSGQHAKAKAAASAKKQDEIQVESTGRPGESVIRLAVNVPREPKKKHAMACLFCRERKIACGRPLPNDEDRRCNQCRKRNLDCVFPKECRRGQHKRISRLARVNARLSAEGLPVGDVMVQGQTPRQPATSSPFILSPSSTSSDTKEKGTPSSNGKSASDAQADGERRAMDRLQRQMVSMHQRRLGQP